MRRVYQIVGYTGHSSGVLPEHVFLLVDETQTSSGTTYLANGTNTTVEGSGTELDPFKVNTTGAEFDLQSALATAPTKDEPADLDKFPLLDSAEGNIVKTTLFSFIRSKLKTYFDTIYAAAGSIGSIQSVTGTLVNNADPDNPVVDAPVVNMLYVQDATLGLRIYTNLSDEQLELPLAGQGGSEANGLMSYAQGVKLSAVKLPTQSAATYASTFTVDFNQTDAARTIALTGNLTFTAASNKAAEKEKSIILTADASARTLAFPAWTWTTAIPTSLAANKKGVLYLYCSGTSESDVIASYAPQTN